MKNIIVLLDEINENLAAGKAPFDAVVAASVAAATSCAPGCRHHRVGRGTAATRCVLECDGDHHHGRSVCGDGDDAAGRTGALRYFLPGASTI